MKLNSISPTCLRILVLSLCYCVAMDTKTNVVSCRDGNLLEKPCCRKRTNDVYNCAGQQLPKFPEDIPSSITKLNLSETGLKSLSSGWLSKARNLRIIDVSSNNLTEFPAMSFTGGKLEVIKMNDNKIKSLSKKNILHLTALRELHIYNNRFTCDCKFLLFIQWLLDSRILVPLMTNIICHYPQNLYGRSVIEILNSGNIDCSRHRTVKERRRRSIDLTDPFAWSCRNVSKFDGTIFLIYTSPNKERELCSTACLAKGFDYFVLESNCSCAIELRSSTNAIVNGQQCNFSCSISTYTNCSFLTFINGTLLTETKSASTKLKTMLSERQGISIRIDYTSISVPTVGVYVRYSELGRSYFVSLQNNGETTILKGNISTYLNQSSLYFPLSSNISYAITVSRQHINAVQWNSSLNSALLSTSVLNCSDLVTQFPCHNYFTNITFTSTTYNCRTSGQARVKVFVSLNFFNVSVVFNSFIMQRVTLVEKIHPTNGIVIPSNTSRHFVVRSDGENSTSTWLYNTKRNVERLYQGCQETCPPEVANNSLCKSSIRKYCYFYVHLTYLSTGVKEIQITVRNPVSNDGVSTKFAFTVERKLILSHIDAICIDYITVSTPINFIVYVKEGNAVYFTFSLNGQEYQSGRNDSFLHTFNKTGDYTLTVKAKSVASTDEKSIQVKVLQNDNLYGLQVLEPRETSLPTNVSITFKVFICNGNNVSFEWKFLEKGKRIITSSSEITYTFSSPGKRKISVRASSEKFRRFTEVKVDYTFYDKINGFNSSLSKNIATRNESILLNVGVTEGTSVTYFYTVNNSSQVSFVSRSKQLFLQNPGIHTFEVFASNPVSTSIKNYHTVQVQDSIAFKIADVFYVKIQSPHHFNVTTISGNFLTVEWIFGDGEKQSYYSGDMIKPAVKTYLSEGDYKVKLTVSNTIRNLTKNSLVVARKAVGNVSIDGPETVATGTITNFTIHVNETSVDPYFLEHDGIKTPFRKSITVVKQFNNTTSTTSRLLWNVSNQVSWRILFSNITVQDKIILQPVNDSYVAVNVSHVLSANILQGSSVFVKWLFPSGNVKTGPTVEYRFNSLGTFRVIMLANNKVSNVSFNFKIHVEFGLSNISIFRNFSTLEVNGVGMFYSSVPYSKENSYSWWIDGVLQSVKERYLNFRFPSVGLHSVLSQVSNNLGHANSSLLYFEVQESISSLDFVLQNDSYNGVVIAGKAIQFRAIIGRGAPISYKWTASTVGEFGSDKEVSLFLNVTHVGRVVVNLTAGNKRGSLSIIKIFQIQHKIEGLKITASSTSVKTGEPMDFFAVISVGTNVSYEWHFHSRSFNQSTSVITNFVFSEIGSFNVSVTAKNIVSERSGRLTINVLDPVENLRVYPLYTLTNSSTQFHAEVSSGTSVLFYWIIHGNPSFHLQGRLNTITFSSAGIKQAYISAQNTVSNTSLSFNITILDRIKILHPFQSKIFSTRNQSFQLNLVHSGSLPSYAWILDEIYIPSQNTQNFSRFFADIGSHSLLVNVSNQLSFDTTETTLIIQESVSEPLLSFCCHGSLTTNQTSTLEATVSRGSNYTFQWFIKGQDVQLNQTGSSIKFITNYAENISVSIIVFNEVSSMKKDFQVIVVDEPKNLSILISSNVIPEGQEVTFKAFHSHASFISYTWSVNTSHYTDFDRTFVHRFPNNGLYVIQLTVHSLLSFRTWTTKRHVTVVSPPCQLPKLSLLGSDTSTIFKSRSFSRTVGISYKCSKDNTKRSWMIVMASKSTRCSLQYNTLRKYQNTGHDLIATNLAFLTIPANYFFPGWYCLVFTFTYGSETRLTSIIAVHLKVINTPLIPQIFGGQDRYIGVNQKLTLNASLTVDPDQEDGLHSPLLYSWSCEPTISQRNRRSQFNLEQFCSRRQWSSSPVTYIPSNIMMINETIQVNLSVRRRNSEETFTASQRIIVVTKTVPVFSIVCSTCPSHSPRKFSPGHVTKLKSLCMNCDTLARNSSLFYNWKVKLRNGTALLSANLTEESLRKPFLILPEHSLNGENDYIITLEIQIGSMSTSSSITIYPNPPPKNGTCELYPNSGFSLATRFTFSCFGAFDSDNRDIPLTYIVQYVNSNHKTRILYYGMESSSSIYFPVGDKTNNFTLRVHVLIQDSLGARSKALDRFITVALPNVKNVGMFLRTNVDGQLAKQVESGDINEAVSIAQAVTEIFKVSQIDENERNNLSSTLTGLLSQLRSSSLDTTEQISSTMRDTVSVSKEGAIQVSSRENLTQFLGIGTKLVSFYSRKQVGISKTLVQNFFYLLLNNINGLGLTSSSSFSRTKRETSSAVSGTKRSTQLIHENFRYKRLLFISVLNTMLIGENASYFNSYEKISLKRISALGSSKILKDRGCTFSISPGMVPNLLDMYEVLNTAGNSSYNWLSDTYSNETASACGLTYFYTNGSEIMIRNLAKGSELEVSIKNRKVDATSPSTFTLKKRSFISGEVIIKHVLHRMSSLTLAIQITPVSVQSTAQISIYFSKNSVPNYKDNSNLVGSQLIPGIFNYFIPAGTFNQSNKYFIGIRNRYGQDAIVSITAFATSCVYLDEKKLVRVTDGCVPTRASTLQTSVCSCNHLTTFFSSLKIKPNPINFSTLTELDLKKNSIALATCLSVLVVYLVLMLFAHQKDDQDRHQVQFIPYLGQDGYYKYEIRVRTSSYPGSGTTANVGMRIFGTKGRTKPLNLSSNNRLQRNSFDMYRFGSEESLGDVWKIRVWHDNQGKSPSWCLTRIVIKDLLSGQKYFFFCNSWLAVDRESGAIEREFYVADEKMMKKFSTIFFDMVGRNFNDYHLWLSIFERPKLSRFTRVQRLTCCVTFLLTWMCVNAMWYGTVPEGQPDLLLGFKAVTYEEIVIGVISNLMVFPINMLIVFVFRKTRTTKAKITDGDDNDVTVYPFTPGSRRVSCEYVEVDDARGQALNGFSKDIPGLRRCNRGIVLESTDLTSLLVGMRNVQDDLESIPLKSEEEDSDLEDDTSPQQTQFEQTRDKVTRFRYRTDSSHSRLRLSNSADEELSALLEDYVVTSNSTTSMRQKSNLSFESATRRHKPFRVNSNLGKNFKIPEIRELHSSLNYSLPPWCQFFGYWSCISLSILSAILILIYGNDFGRDVAIKWLKSMLIALLQDIFITYPLVVILGAAIVACFAKPMNLDSSDFILCHVMQNSASLEPGVVNPLRGPQLKLAQKEGRKRRKIWKIIKFSVTLIVTLWLVLSITFVSYQSHMALASSEIFKLLNSKPHGLKTVSRIPEYWTWASVTLTDFLHPGYKRDWQLVSNPNIRQLRVKSSTCPVPDTANRSGIPNCNLAYSSETEETSPFLPNWIKVFRSPASAWTYRNADNINGTRFKGRMGSYPKTGYTAHLGYDRRSTLKILNNLQEKDWFDKYTRAMFVEFVLHNININKYVVITISTEISPAGYLLSDIELLYVKFHMYSVSLDFFKLFCEVIFGLLGFYFSFKTGEKLWKHKLAFFHSFWKVHLMVMAIISLTVSSLSIYRLVQFNGLQPDIKKGIPNNYNLRSMAMLDNVITYLYGFVSFWTILKGTRLLNWTSIYTSIGLAFTYGWNLILCFCILYIIGIIAFASWLYLVFSSHVYNFNTFWAAFMYTLSFRNWSDEITTMRTANEGHTLAWYILYFNVMIILFVALLRATLNNEFRDIRIPWGVTRRSVKFSGSYHGRRSKKRKRVQFAESSSAGTLETATISEQTVCIPCDPGFFLDYQYPVRTATRMSVDLLNPRAESVLNHVRDLEEEEVLAEEFYSVMERALRTGKISLQ